jgi:hypothetical protein
LKSNPCSGSVHFGSFAALTILGGVHENASSTVPSFYRLLSNVFCKNTKNTDTTILSVYSLSLVTIITGHLILTKNSKSVLYIFSRVSDKVTVLRKRQLCVVKCKRKDLLSTSIVGKKYFSSLGQISTIIQAFVLN